MTHPQLIVFKHLLNIIFNCMKTRQVGRQVFLSTAKLLSYSYNNSLLVNRKRGQYGKTETVG